MKKTIAFLLVLTLAATPMAAPVASATHRCHNCNDLSVGEAVAALVIAGLIVAAVGPESHSYVGSPWGVIDTEVSPKDAEMYIDGGYVGKARQFDGWPGYLPLEPGTYRIEFRLPGYAPFRIRARVLAGRRLVIKKRLRKLAPGEATPAPESVPPQGRAEDPDQDRGDWRWDEPSGRRGPGGPSSRSEPPPEAQGPPPEARDEPPPRTPDQDRSQDLPQMSELRLQIAPEDASVYLNGEFHVNAKDLEGGSRAIMLAPGEYKLEVVRPGYKSQSFTVVLGSEPRTLKIEMERQ
jgi:hypothetical protein